MEKSTQNTNRVKSSQPNSKEISSQKSTNIPQGYFNASHPAPTEDQALQRPYFNDKQESNSQDATNIPQGYFNSGHPKADQASQRQYFNDAQNNPNNQPNQSVGPNYLDQGIPGYTKNRSQYAFQTSSNLNNRTQVNPAPQSQVSQPRQRELTETMTFKGNDGQSYEVLPYLSKDEANEVAEQSGVLLKKDSANPDRYSGYLGGGYFGRVYVAKSSNSNKYVAVKIIQGNESALTESAHESTLQRKLTQVVKQEDSQLMPMYDAIEVRENGKLVALYTAMPLAALGSAQDLRKELNNLDNVSGSFRRLLILHIAKGVLIGLYQMHREHIYHLDFHSGNIMITGEGKVQIADFGTSEEISANPPLLSVHQNQDGRTIGVGAIRYFPPERPRELGTRQFNPAKSDLYGVGALLWEFITGEEFPSIRNNNQIVNHPLLQNPIPNSIVHLAKQLLSENPNSRPSVEAALNHLSLCQSEVHDQALNSTVIDFLKRFVRHTQRKAQGDLTQQQAKEVLQAELRKSQLETSSDPLQLNPLLITPFNNRPDIQEQLAMYLPLNASFKRKVEDPKQDTFDLNQYTQKFLSDPKQTLLLLLADGGSGKSLFMQYLTTSLLQNKVIAPNSKPYLPLYIVLSNIKNPDRLFEEGLNLTPEAINVLQQNYQILILADGYDEQTTWSNLYIQNQLQRYDTTHNNIRHSIKLIITCRVNALPSNYVEYFSPRVAGEASARPMQEIYVQPFQTDQIDTYVTNYIEQYKSTIKEQIEQKQLPSQWLSHKYVQDQIKQILGLKELMQTPLLSQLILIALPQLSHTQRARGSSVIKRAEVYNAFMRQWVITQMITKQHKSASQITEAEINQTLSFGQKIASTMYENNKSAQLDVGLSSFSFNPIIGKYQQDPNKYPWFAQGKQQQTLLPLQESQSGVYKFVHLSMQEYLLASCLKDELIQSNTLKDLTLNKLALTLEVKDRPILYFLGDMASKLPQFADKLFALIYQTREDKTQSIAGANAISILNVSDVALINRDFSNTNLSHSDLSGGVLFNTNLSKADLSNSNLQGAKLSNSNFREANLRQISLGQYPMLRLIGPIKALCYSPDGRYLAISQFEEVRVFDAATCKEIGCLNGHTDWVTSISFSGDGTRVATGSEDNTARIYNVISGKCLKILSGHTKQVSSVSFSADGTRVATGGWDTTVRIYNVKTGECIRVVSGCGSYINSLSFSTDSTKIATGNLDQTARIYDAESGECIQILSGHSGFVNSVSFSKDGIRLVTGSNDETVRIYDVKSGECSQILNNSGIVTSVSFSPDGRRVAIGGSDKNARIYDAESGEVIKVLSGHIDMINSVSFSPDGSKVVTGSIDGTARVHNANSGECLKLLSGHIREINSVSFRGDGKRVATSSPDQTARIYDAESGECIRVLTGHTRYIESVSFSEDGTMVATGSWDKTARIYDAETGECFRILEHSYIINSVSFSADGSKLITKNIRDIEKIWVLSSGEELKGDQGGLELRSSSYQSLDSLSASYKRNVVNLTQNKLSDSMTTQVEKFSLKFPSDIKDVSLCNTQLGDKIILTVVMENGIAFYSKGINALLSEFAAIKVSMTDQGLDTNKMDLSNSVGLSQSNYDVLEQLGAIGKPLRLSLAQDDILESEEFEHLPKVVMSDTRGASGNKIGKFLSGIFKIPNISKGEED